ncbi:hypothetical protein [Qipengyuania sediminis]|uniref:hypothetical protein n=1 Tax=Qipengyuania sediminis TaxID=1532023 RepID=UPI0014053954|nr:hypothetical protein [Qipengyuania sediminis]
MSEFQIVALIALAGSLLLVAPGLAGRGMTLSKGLRLALVWVGLFAIVTLFISVISP